jgi:hypothetical protein
VSGEVRTRTRPWPVLLVAVLLLCAFAATYVASATVAPTPAQAGDFYKRCGSQHHGGAGWYHVRAHKVSCRVARHVARHFWNSGGDSHFEGWSCHSQQVGDEVWKARCTRQRPGRFQVVRFVYGA